MKPEARNLPPPAWHWAWSVALLYGLILVLLAAPVIQLAFWRETNLQAFEVYQCWPFWAGLPVMVLCQVALLAVPVQVAGGRPVPQRSIFLTVLSCGFMVGLLVVGAGFSIIEYVYKGKPGPESLPWLMWSIGPLTWLIWTWVFAWISQHTDPSAVVAYQRRGLLHGSVLELLIAVPTHIVARHRNYCCAGVMTFVGLTTGIAVMLFAFGPSVFQLYVNRWRRLHPSPLSNLADQTRATN
jgi:hypothetical protein